MIDSEEEVLHLQHGFATLLDLDQQSSQSQDAQPTEHTHSPIGTLLLLFIQDNKQEAEKINKQNLKTGVHLHKIKVA